MSPRRAKKTDVDIENTRALEPKAGGTGAKAPPSPGKTKAGADGNELKAVDEVLSHYPAEEPSLIMVLQEINDRFNWLPPEAMNRVAGALDLPLAKVLGVATFYKALSLEPKGERTVKVCLGTACHVRGAGMLVDELKRSLEVEVGRGISPDGAYSLETVNCVGACAMAPVVVVEDNYYAHMEPGNIAKMLKKERPK